MYFHGLRVRLSKHQAFIVVLRRNADPERDGGHQARIERPHPMTPATRVARSRQSSRRQRTARSRTMQQCNEVSQTERLRQIEGSAGDRLENSPMTLRKHAGPLTAVDPPEGSGDDALRKRESRESRRTEVVLMISEAPGSRPPRRHEQPPLQADAWTGHS